MRRNYLALASLGLLLMMTASSLVAEPGGVLVIAHRGASQVAPENTKSAMAAAIKAKAPVIEFDVRVTADRELILFHDSSLERVAGKKGSIEKSQWEEIRSLDVGRWFGDGKFAGETPLRLEEAIQFCAENGAIALVEHKSGTAEAYADVIRKWENTDTVIIQSFDWKFLRAFQDLMPEIPLGALGSEKLSADRLSQLKSFRPVWVGWKYSDLSAANLKSLQSENFRVALWTINDPKQAESWINRGVDAIITDRPGAMLTLLSEIDATSSGE